MERLYTEAEWRAITELEQLVDRWMDANEEKIIVGWSYGGGEFYLAHHIPWANEKFIGPVAPEFFVFEGNSQSRITWSETSKAEALADARKRLSDCPEDHLLSIFKERQEALASYEASCVIRRAKREKKPRKIGKRLREIFAAANGICHYCETKLELTGQWEVDHKMPKALGGSNERTNLVAACMPCNRSKRDKTDIEFLEILAQRTST